MSTNSHYSLGGNYTFPSSSFTSPISGTPYLPSTPAFGFSFAAAPPPVATPIFHFNLASSLPPSLPPAPLIVAHLPLSSDPKPPGIGLVTGTAKAFLKDELPPVTKTVGVIASAAIAAKKINDGANKALDQGQPTGEAYTCQTAKVLAEELSGKWMKGAIVGGIPPYLAAATTSLPIAATVPVVLPLIPQAYQGAQATAQRVGEAAEATCHNAFDLARQLSHEGGSK